jgi:hypothetical protein
VHYAFDVEHSRLAKAWRGRFLDARGTWHARAGQLEKPAGEDVLEFPEGPAFAVLENENDPWPASSEGWRALGRTLDADGRPVFRYALGSVTITDAIQAEVRSGGAVLRRSIRLHSSAFAALDMRIAVGDSISPDGERTWRVDGATPCRIRVTRGSLVAVVDGGDGRAELRAHVPVGVFLHHISKENAESGWIELEYSW